jgi:hypothetical protein
VLSANDRAVAIALHPDPLNSSASNAPLSDFLLDILQLMVNSHNLLKLLRSGLFGPLQKFVDALTFDSATGGEGRRSDVPSHA